MLCTHTLVTTEYPYRASEIAARKHEERAGLASLDWCPDFSGGGDSDTEAHRGDSREEFHVCTFVVLELREESLYV